MKIAKFNVHTGASRFNNRNYDLHQKVFGKLQVWAVDYNSEIDGANGELLFTDAEINSQQANWLRQLGAEVVPQNS